MDNRVTDREQHPDPSRYWRHRRRLAYTAMACLIVTLAVALFGTVRSPELVEGLAWAFATIVIGYYGNNAIEAFSRGRRPK